MTRKPTLRELRAKALFFGFQAAQTKFTGIKTEYPWCVEKIDDPESGIWMRGHWHRTEHGALWEFFQQCKIHGYPDR